MLFELEFEFRCGKNWPILEFIDPVSMTERPISNFFKQVNVKINTSQPFLRFNNTNKTESDTVVNAGQIIRDQSIKVKNIWADDILLNFNFLNSYISFKPNYSDYFLQYCKQNNIVVDNSPYPFEIFHNGKWSLNFDLPFWEWYSLRRQEHISKNLNASEIELFIGTNSTNRQDSLIKLKKLLNV